MKKIMIAVVMCLAIIFVGMRGIITFGSADVNMKKDNLTQVTAPDQKEAQANEAFTVEEYVPPVIEGTNVALEGKATANAFNDVYEAKFANDGNRKGSSYWEGSTTEKENSLTIELKDSHKVNTVVVALSPVAIWSKRTQTMSVSVSEDGKNFTDIAPSADCVFDPKTGNQVVIDAKNVSAKFVKVSITKNTGAAGGQIAELEVYSKD